MKWIDPVYDRTANDIANRTAKAFLNVADWLRIYGNSQIVNALANILHGLGVSFQELGPPTITSFPTAAEVNTLIRNIENVRSAVMFPASAIVPLAPAYQSGPGATAPDYEDVNAWERDLGLLLVFLRNHADWIAYCGVAACGQPRYYQVRWRRWPWVGAAATPARRPRCGIAAAGAGLARNNSFRRYE